MPMATIERTVGAQPEPDDISAVTMLPLDEIYGVERYETETFQLVAAKRRFEELAVLKSLKSQADRAGISALRSLEDVVPLLFDHGVYKSYPIALLEKNRFDLLTKWLGGTTTTDVSAVDASGIESIDDWLALLERETPLRVCHTSGTSGKLSFIPRTGTECDFWCKSQLKAWEPFREEPGCVLGDNGARLPVIYPSARYGRYIMQRIIAYLAEHVAPTPDQCYTMTNGTLSADLASLSGRVRIAQAKGELSRMSLSDAMRVAMRRYLEDLDRRPQEMAAFFERIFGELQGQRVYLASQTSYLYQASMAGLERGRSQVFSSDSLGSIGGGGKELALPEDFMATIGDFTGIRVFRDCYGMSELNAAMPRCPLGHVHFPRHIVPFLVDVMTGATLPRSGRSTGRFAALDLSAQTYWGGVVSSDKLTVEWDEPCGCGRSGAYAVGDVTRYDAAVTGDEKVTCSATVDNTDAALQALLNI